MCVDATTIFLALFWFALGNAVVGLVLFFVVRFFVRLNAAHTNSASDSSSNSEVAPN